MIKLLTAAALLGGQAAAQPPPAPAPCITRQQVSDFTLVGTSIFVTGARRLCREHLPAGAFLLTPAAERFEASLRAEAERRLDSLLASLESLFPMVATMIRPMMTNGPGPELARLADAPACGDLSQMIEAMSAMSPQQFGQFAAALLSLASRMEARDRARRAAQAAAEPAPAGDSSPGPEEPAPAPAPAPPPMPMMCLE